MPGFGHNPFGNFPFGHFDWSRQVLYRILPELHKRQDVEQGFPLAQLVEGERPSFEKLRQKIQQFGDLRDPLVARSQYNESVLVTLGKKIVTKGAVLQRGFNGSITAFGEFVSPSVRFNPTHTGKELEISRSSDPAHNQVVTIAQVDAATPTLAAIAPPLGADAGPLTWELREASVEPSDRTLMEVTFGDVSSVTPGWVVFDGFAEFEVLARTQLELRTEREGADGILDGTSKTLTGSVSVVAGGTTVTGVGTLFLAEVKIGSYIKLTAHQDTAYTKVAKILTNTSLVLAGGYQGVSGTGTSKYTFHRFILALNRLTLEDIGKRLTLSGSSIVSNNDKYEIENVLKLSPSDPTYAGVTVPLTGTVSVTNGLTSVTGVGTLFLTQVAPGGYIKLAAHETSVYARVVTILSNFALTLETGYTGTSGAGIGQYTVDPTYRLATVRRIGPSDFVTAGTPISTDSGPLDWAILARSQLALKGRTQVIRGLVEQYGFDAVITAIGPRSGVAASITAVAAGLVTVTGLTDMSFGDAGRFITISGAATPANNGTFRIAVFVSSTSVKYTNLAGVFPDANSGAISWITLAADQVELQIPSGRFSPDLSGSVASITTKSGNSMTVVGLTGMEPSCVGQLLVISGAASSGNNSTTPFTITQYVSATSVVYTNALGVSSDANNGAIAWVYNSPDRGKLLALRGPGANNGTVEVKGVALNSITVAQRVTPQIGTPALPDLPSPFTLDAGPLEWELRTKTTFTGTSESPAFQQVRVRAPSLLQYLAKDFGIDIDIRETESRQRSWVKNNARWIGIKGLAKAYSILGDISGFNITPEALYHITQDLSLAIPQEFLYETGEYALGRSAPNPVHSVSSDPLWRDGSLRPGNGGRVRFSAPTARFKPSDVGLLIRIEQSLTPGNNKLYTIDQIPPDHGAFPGDPSEADGYIHTVEFRLVDTAIVPDPQNGALQWNLTKLYTTQPPLRARFDDLDPELMGQLINPPATTYFTGASSLGDILYISKVAGTFGESIRIQQVSTGALSVSVVGTDITVTFNAGVTTANAVAAAIAALPAAAALVLAVPQNGGTGFLFPHSFTYLLGGEDHFALDKFCWEESFDSSIDGMLPFLALGASTNGNIQYTPGVNGDFGVRITHNPVALAPVSVAVSGNQVVVTYDSATATANDVATAILASSEASLLLVATAAAGGAGLLSPVTLTNVILSIVPGGVIQSAENLWSVTVSGPLNVVQDVQGGNWRMTDENGVDFFLESLPVASGANWVVTVFSAIEPAVGKPFPSPVVLTYDCVPIFSCDYCAASKVLLTLEPGTIFEDAQNALALELILNRMLGRITQVTPAHVQTIVLFSSALSASLNLQAYFEAGLTSTLPLLAPLQAYYDDIEGDIVPIDSLSLDAYVEGPYFTINVGAITAFGGVTATMSGFSGPLSNVVGQNIVITGAATPANNGTFPITGYVSGPITSTISYTNAAGVAPDANNGSIIASTTP